MNHAPETVLLDAALDSCETRLRATIEHLVALQTTLDGEIDRLGDLERAVADLPAESLAPSAPGMGAPAAEPLPCSPHSLLPAANVAYGQPLAREALNRSPHGLSPAIECRPARAPAGTAPLALAARSSEIGPSGPSGASGAARAPQLVLPLPRLRVARRAWLALAAVALAASIGDVVTLGRGGAPRDTGLLLVADEPTLVRLSGTVRLWRADTDWMTVESATAVRPGDRVRTEADGYAAVTWPSGAAAALDPDGALTIAPPAPDGTVRVELGAGAAWLDGGHEPGSRPVEALTAEGARVAGPRFQLRRDAAGRLLVSSTDQPVAVGARGTRQEVPPGSSSEVLPGQRPALARPVTLVPALAITVDGPPAWVVVDRLGRGVGAPPGGGPWLDQVPAARGPLPRPNGASVVVPDPQGDLRLVMWADDSPRDYAVAAWSTSGQALYGGEPPAEDAGALHLQGSIPAGGAVTVTLAVRDRGVAVAGPVHGLDAVPSWLRLAAGSAAAASRLASVPPELPRASAAAPPAPPAPPELSSSAPAALPLPPQAPAQAAEPTATAVPSVPSPAPTDPVAAAAASAAADSTPPEPSAAASPEPADLADASEPEDAAASVEPAPVASRDGAALQIGGPLPDPNAPAALPTPTPTPRRSPTPDPETLPLVTAPNFVSTITVGNARAATATISLTTTVMPLASAVRATPTVDLRLFASPTPFLPDILPSPTPPPIVITVVLPRTTPVPTAITLRGFPTLPATLTPAIVGTPGPSSPPAARPR